jgi:hypothetical protein
MDLANRRVVIDEDEDGTVEVLIYPARIRYEFESWGEAIEALPNLENI